MKTRPLARALASLAALVAVLASAPPASAAAAADPVEAIPVEVILKKAVDAYGGEAALEKQTKRIRQSGTVTSIMKAGVKAPLLREFERPDRLHVQIQYGNEFEKRVWNGKKGWRQGEAVTGMQYDAMVLQAARMSMPLNLWRERSRVIDRGYALLGEKKLKAVELPLPGGLMLIAEIDPETGRILQSFGGGGPQKLRFITTYSDFRKVGGILFAFKEGNWANGMTTGETVLEKVEFPASFPKETFKP